MEEFSLDALREEIKGTSPKDNKIDIQDNSSFSLEELKKEVGSSLSARQARPGFEIEDYSKYIGEVFDPTSNIDEARWRNQSTGSKILGTLNKALVGEVVGGSLEGIGHFGDIKQTIDALEGNTQEWGNWLTDIGKDLRTWSEESTPVYLDPASEGKFAPWTSDWWYRNAPSMASTLSLMIPSAGIVKGASLLGKALNIGQKMGKVASFATRGIGQAVASRLMENGMEALGNYEDTKQTLMSQGIDEETATREASNAASNTWNLNWAMLAQDIPQYMLLNSTLGKSLKATGEATPSVLKALGKSATNAQFSAASKIGLDMLGESGEEMYQYAVNETSKRLAETNLGLREKESLSEQLGEYIKEGEFWTSAAIGALGAGVMQTAGKKINDAIANYNGTLTPEQKRINNIQNWAGNKKFWQDIINDAKITGDVDKESAARQGMIRTMGVSAAANQNLGALRDMFETIKSGKHSQEDLNRLGITEEELPDIQKNADNYIKTLNKIEEKYDNYVNLNLKKPVVPDNLIPFLVQEEVRLDDLRERKAVVDSEKESLQGSIANLNALDSLSQEMQLNGVSIQVLQENNKKLTAYLEKFKDTLSEEAVESTKKNIALNEEKIKKINEHVKELKKTDKRTAEEKAASKKFNKNQAEVQRFVRLLSLSNQIDSSINASTDMVATILDKKYQQKVSELVSKSKEKSLIQAVKEAKRIVDLEEAQKNAKGTPAEKVVNKVIKEKKQETPNYYESDTTHDINKVYTEDGAEKLQFKDDMKQISSLVNNKIVELSEKASGNELTKLEALQNKFLPTLGIAELNEVLKNLKSVVALAEFSGVIDSVEGQILNIIRDFINNKFTAQQDEFNDEITYFQGGAEGTVKDPVLTEANSRGANVVNNWEYNFVWEDGVWKATNEKADSLVKSDRYNPEIINTPGNFPANSIVHLEVDFNEKFSPTNKNAKTKDGMVEITPANFQIQLVSYDLDGNGHVIGTLPDANNVSTKTQANQANKNILMAKRLEIWNQIQSLPKAQQKGVFKTGLTTKIETKNAGRIIRTKKTLAPHQLIEDTSLPLYFTVIYSDKQGNKYASTPNIPSGPYKTAVTDTFIQNAEVGAVYMLVPASNGAIIPVRMFTNRVQDLTKAEREKLTEQVKTLLLSTTVENKKLVNKEINKLVYLVYNFKNDTISIKVGTKTVSFTKQQLIDNPKILDDILDKMVVQVDRNAINSGDYNQTISKQGRLKANLNPKRFTHSTSFVISLTDIKQSAEKPIVPKQKPVEKPLEKGSNFGGKNMSTGGTSVETPTPQKKVKEKPGKDLVESGIITNFDELLANVDKYLESLKIAGMDTIREQEYAEGKEIKEHCTKKATSEESAPKTTGRTPKTPSSKPKGTPSKGDVKTGIQI